MREQNTYRPQFEDWLFHVLLPLAAYTIPGVSALTANSYTRQPLFGIGTSALLLFFAGIDNSWDTVTYHVFGKTNEENGEAERGDETSASNGKDRNEPEEISE